MKRWIERFFGVVLVLSVLGLVVGAGGFLVSTTGLIPITASSGHWPITSWFLQYSKKRSVSTHAWPTTAPRLDDAALVVRGAGQYETACRDCHGIPGSALPRVAARMTPPPPDLGARLGEWSVEELFYIVKHGIKFTGMPAWPTQKRDDEVWAMVAFLRQWHRLGQDGYYALAQPHRESASALLPAERVARVALESCARCHGLDGEGEKTGAYPILSGQKAEYLENALRAYASGSRPSGIMGPVAATIDGELMKSLSRHYARQTQATAPHAASARPEQVVSGRVLFEQGEPKKRIPACIECHSRDGSQTKPEYPILAGQPANYLSTQLKLYQTKTRAGTPHAHLMHEIAPRLTAEQIEAVSAYISTLSRGKPD